MDNYQDQPRPPRGNNSRDDYQQGGHKPYSQGEPRPYSGRYEQSRDDRSGYDRRYNSASYERREDHPPARDNYENRNYNRRDDSPREERGGYENRNYNRPYENRRDERSGGGYENRNYNRPYDNRRDERSGGGYENRNYNRPYDNRRDERSSGGYENRNYNRPYDNRRDERSGGGYENRNYNRPYDNRRDERSSGGYENRNYNRRDERSGGSYGNRAYDNRRDERGGNYGNRAYDHRRDERGGGYRKPYGQQQGRPPYRREGGRFQERPRRKAPAISIPDSPFLLPEHPLTQDFQRAIGMTKGTIVDVDPRKKRGLIEIDGFQYKFEDERKRDLQRKYPIQKFKDREIQFAFWPTYSQKAAQYRKIDEAPTIKIANLRRTLPQAGVVEIIGQVLMVEEALFVMSVFSATQHKKYMVTVLQKYPGAIGEFIQMFGELKDGGIHYQSHRVISTLPEEAVAAETVAQPEA